MTSRLNLAPSIVVMRCIRFGVGLLLVIGCQDDSAAGAVADASAVSDIAEPLDDAFAGPKDDVAAPTDIGGSPQDVWAPPPVALEGWWANRYVGGCIDLEERYRFEPLGGFTFQVIDNNACAEPSSSELTGTWRHEAPGVLVLTADGESGDGSPRGYERATSYVVTGLENDTPILNGSAYHRDGASYVRTDHRLDYRNGQLSDVRLESRVTLIVGGDGDDCRMDVVLSGMTEYTDSPLALGEVEFSLLCQLGPLLAGDGSNTGWQVAEYSGDWTEYWNAEHADSVPASVSNIMRGYFTPALRFRPEADGAPPAFLLGAGQSWFKDDMSL